LDIFSTIATPERGAEFVVGAYAVLEIDNATKNGTKKAYQENKYNMEQKTNGYNRLLQRVNQAKQACEDAFANFKSDVNEETYNIVKEKCDNEEFVDTKKVLDAGQLLADKVEKTCDEAFEKFEKNINETTYNDVKEKCETVVYRVVEADHLRCVDNFKTKVINKNQWMTDNEVGLWIEKECKYIENKEQKTTITNDLRSMMAYQAEKKCRDKFNTDVIGAHNANNFTKLFKNVKPKASDVNEWITENCKQLKDEKKFAIENEFKKLLCQDAFQNFEKNINEKTYNNVKEKCKTVDDYLVENAAKLLCVNKFKKLLLKDKVHRNL
jgi:hypothetical protein